MKNYRFYEEYDNSTAKRKRIGSGNVLALDLDGQGRPYGHTDYMNRYVMSCTAAVFSNPNSGVAGTQVARDVLSRNYRRIPESKARQIHPRMFAFLDQFDSEGNLK